MGKRFLRIYENQKNYSCTEKKKSISLKNAKTEKIGSEFFCLFPVPGLFHL